MDVEALADAIKAISKTMELNRDYLIALDQQNGDGDLGISMANGFSAIASYLESTDEKDLGRALMRCSSLLNETSPSTLGTILSFGLLGMAKTLKGKLEASLMEIVQAFESGLSLIMERAHSKEGEKTILDSLAPAIRALKVNLQENQNEDCEAAFASAALKAAEGSEATRTMKPVHGRAAYYSDASLGVIDAGSVVGKLIFESLSQWAFNRKKMSI